MRKYETVFISDPDLKDKARQDLFDKIGNIIKKEKGLLLNFEEWGNKKLAYEIKKKMRGHYACLTYGGTGDLVKELERNMRLSDPILKYMTILLSDDVTVEQLEKEILDAQPEEAPEKAPAKEETVEKEKVADGASKEDEKVEETQEETS
ncbi:MAG: 30S ribosomal protein S6 [Desulfobacteraceae bacterium]|nr:30S ribosomal protein S6 [Desulfobacteraceae bacterium]